MEFTLNSRNKTLHFARDEVWITYRGHSERVTEHGHAEKTIHGSSADELKRYFPDIYFPEVARALGSASPENLGNGKWRVGTLECFLLVGDLAKVASYKGTALVEWNGSVWIVTTK